MSVEKEITRKKVKLVIPFLYVETMRVNGVDTPDPHPFSAETDRFPAVSKSLNALQDHVRNRVIRQIEVLAHRSVKFMWICDHRNIS